MRGVWRDTASAALILVVFMAPLLIAPGSLPGLREWGAVAAPGVHDLRLIGLVAAGQTAGAVTGMLMLVALASALIRGALSVANRWRPDGSPGPLDGTPGTRLRIKGKAIVMGTAATVAAAVLGSTAVGAAAAGEWTYATACAAALFAVSIAGAVTVRKNVADLHHLSAKGTSEEAASHV